MWDQKLLTEETDESWTLSITRSLYECFSPQTFHQFRVSLTKLSSRVSTTQQHLTFTFKTEKVSSPCFFSMNIYSWSGVNWHEVTLNPLQLIQVHKSICSITLVTHISSVNSQFSYTCQTERRSTDLEVPPMARVIAIINSLDAWWKHMHVFLQFSEHKKASIVVFFKANSGAEEWHIVPAYVSAEMTGLKWNPTTCLQCLMYGSICSHQLEGRPCIIKSNLL